MSTANRVIKNTFWLYGKMGITMFISLYTTRLILNSLGASDFGIFNIVGGSIAMLGFLNAAMASATQRFMSYSEGEGDKEKQKVIFNVSCILHTIISIVLGLALFIVGFILFDGILNIPAERLLAAKVIFGALIISTMFTVMNVPYDAILNAHENMKYYAFVGIFESLLKLAVAYVCVYTLSDKLVVYGLLMACIPFVTLSIMKIYCHRNYQECILAPRRYYDKSVLREMTGFAGWNLFSTSASMITNNGVGIVMNMFFGTVINAAQGVANQICGQLMSLTTIMNKAVSPVITKSEGQQEHGQTLRMAATSSKALYFITSLLALPAIITMSDLLNLWLKNVPDYAVFFASVQLMISLCEQLTGAYGTAINATGRIKGISIVKSVAKFSYLPISYILFKMGCSVVVAYCCLFVIQGLVNGLCVPVYYTNKIFNIKIFKYIQTILFPAFVTTAITCFAGYSIAGFTVGWLSVVLTAILCAVVNSVCFYLITLNGQERAMVVRLMHTVSSKMICCK